jgi:predicted transcriptional regulator
LKVYELKGREVVMYSIGELAKELGRESQTIRKWEQAGIIPPTRFRDKTNKRLYPQEIVEGLKRISEEEDITQGVSFTTTDFKKRAFELFKRVEADLLGGE